MTSFVNMPLKLDTVGGVPMGLLPREGDGYFQGKRMLYPSPVAGRGSRLFTLFHVLVHVTSVILTIALLTDAGAHAADNKIHGDQAALIFSLLLLLTGIVAIITVSVTSRSPFSQHGIIHALSIWAFVGAFACLVFAFDGINSTIAVDHSSRLLGLFTAMMQSLGIATLMAAFITATLSLNLTLTLSPGHRPHPHTRPNQGVAASNAPYDDRATTA